MNIKKPTLIVSKSKVEQNIGNMYNKAVKNNLIFRPHFKTHQNAGIGELYKKFGVSKITVSSVSMAKYFYTNGWKDITIAFPINWTEMDDINELASNIVLNVVVASKESMQFLVNNVKFPLNVFIKIDTGYHRTGLDFTEKDEISQIFEIGCKKSLITIKGFLAHFGHTYKAKTKQKIYDIYNESVNGLISLKNEFEQKYGKLLISIGDTPSCSLVDDLIGCDEIRPGNFVFYDVMQLFIGSCTVSNIAFAVACPVVAKNESRCEIIIYGGAVHLSKDFVLNEKNEPLFGLVTTFDGEKWSLPLEDTYILGVSQEHGIIKTIPSVFEKIKIGSVLNVLPVHSCLAADLIKNFVFVK